LNTLKLNAECVHQAHSIDTLTELMGNDSKDSDRVVKEQCRSQWSACSE